MKLIIVLLLSAFIFLRFWDIEGRMQFTWDQVQNAWVMKDMLVDHKMPLEGMVAKLNSGIHIGPAYYYLLVPFYWVYNLEPVAAGVFAGVVALITAGVLFVAVKKLFSNRIALAALAFYTFSTRIITQDRIAWPVIFLPMLAIGVYFSLVRIMEGRTKYLLLLAAVLGFSLHIHFTAIFFFLYTLLCVPFMAGKKNFWKYTAVALPVFFVWILPMIGRTPGNLNYFQTYYHGFHFVRVAQLIGDALIEFPAIIGISQLRILSYLMLPLFLYFSRKNFRLFYLTIMWFLVPLIVFSLYSGEISDYYFTVTRPIVVLIYAYIVVKFLAMGKWWITLPCVLLCMYVLLYNMNVFFRNNFGNHVGKIRKEVLSEIEKGNTLNFAEGDPKSYFYYIYAQR